MRDLGELLTFATALAKEAGNISLAAFGKDTRRERKADGSIVTAADRESERLMRQRIEHRFPNDGIVGEEFGTTEGTSGRRWILDPIDGTFSFSHRVPLFGVLVGLEIDGQPSVGIVHLPALAETVAAAKGSGCYWNDKPARVSSVARLNEALVVCGDFYASRNFGLGEATERIQRAADQRRGWGDCYGHILVATGRAEIALDPVMHIWDCAALAPIIEEAGGTFTDWQGARTIDGGNAVSTNGLLFDDIMRLIQPAASQQR